MNENDLDRLRTDTWEFVERCAAGASKRQKAGAVEAIVRSLRFMFDRHGMRLKEFARESKRQPDSAGQRPSSGEPATATVAAGSESGSQ